MLLSKVVLSALAGVSAAETGRGLNAAREVALSSLPAAISQLNNSVGGRLYDLQPFARPCFSRYNGAPAKSDVIACAAIRENYKSNPFRADHPSGYMLAQDEFCLSQPGNECLLDTTTSPPALPGAEESCAQGAVPTSYIDVREAADAIAGFEHARTTRTALAIKNSGHDYVARNSQEGALGLWVHNLKGLEYHNNFKPEGCTHKSVGRAITAAAGERTGDIYIFASKHNGTFVGGYSGTIAASGGWVQGGGHSVLAPVYGTGADRVVQFKVVTPDGQVRIANRCQNADLFRALRGGGGGTFGLVLEATHRVEPRVPIAFASIKLPSNITSADALRWVELQARESLKWGREGWGGHVAGSYLAHMNPLPNIANMSDGGFAAKESMRRASEFALVLGGTSEIVVMEDWLALWNKYLNVQTGPGGVLFLTNRLLPRDLFADDAGIEKIMSFLRYTASLGFDPKSLYVPVGTPFVAGAGDGKSPFNDDEDPGTSLHPAWYSSLWEMSASVAMPWNATLKEREEGLVRLTKVTRAAEELTGPEAATYMNEANPMTQRWREAWWGPHYEALLETKRKYDPNKLLQCWKCVGFEDGDAERRRFRCPGKIQDHVYTELKETA